MGALPNPECPGLPNVGAFDASKPPDALSLLPDNLIRLACRLAWLHNTNMISNFGPHLEIALRHAASSTVVTPIPRVELHVGYGESVETPCLYRSVVCFLLQGRKRVAVHADLLSYDSSHYLVSALDLPLAGQLSNADRRHPYVALMLLLDPALLAELATTMSPVYEDNTKTGRISINPMTVEIQDILLRLLSLLDKPADIPFLAPMVERELLYRILQGPQGRLLRQIAQPEGQLARIRRAVAWIQKNRDRQMRINALCEASGMSRASLHRHFLAMTGFSPLQYQKQLRLQEARRLLLAGEHSPSGVAFAVGYESVSQFSREYLRQFGAPPAKDVRSVRRQVELMSVPKLNSAT